MIILGDCLDKLKQIEDNSLDCLVTDPPYGISFMGKKWDKALPDKAIWEECLRVLKPGSFGFVMCTPRQDCLSRMIISLEEAGFMVNFTSIYWTYFTGFPKAHNIGKMLDKRANKLNLQDYASFEKEKPPIDRYDDSGRLVIDWKKGIGVEDHKGYGGIARGSTGVKQKPCWLPVYSADSKPLEAVALDGSYAGFQPKPAVEPIIVVMKPLSESGYTNQALNNCKGVTWLDDCRIPTNDTWKQPKGVEWSPERHWKSECIRTSNDKGRFPANLIVSDDRLNTDSRYFDLDKWFDTTYPFLCIPKASKKEKNKGMEEVEDTTIVGRDTYQDTTSVLYKHRPTATKNNHPTIKPIKLLSYLIVLGSREGETILDPFVGSGSTALAAIDLGRRYVAIELNEDYYNIAEQRILSKE